VSRLEVSFFEDTHDEGAALIVIAAPVVLTPKAWEDATTVLLGFALLVSAWVLDFTGTQRRHPVRSSRKRCSWVSGLGPWRAHVRTEGADDEGALGFEQRDIAV
jgi:hypothetical protein